MGHCDNKELQQQQQQQQRQRQQQTSTFSEIAQLTVSLPLLERLVLLPLELRESPLDECILDG